MKRVDVDIHDSGCLIGKPQVATIGFFDGVHLGHRYLISQLHPEADEESLVVTFDCHPLTILRPDLHPHVLSSPDIKLLLLSYTNVDNVAVLHFDTDMASLSAREFMQQILRDRLNVRRLVLGYDNHFGKREKGCDEGFEDYVAYGRDLGIDVKRAAEWTHDGEKVSSSVIRRYLQSGDIKLANERLGYEYTIVGKVVRGYQEGRKMGFPTANIDTAEWGQLVPAPGVYAVKVRQKNSMAWRWGMMNIGMRPTFDGHEQTSEIHIIDFSGDIYGETLLVKFISRIREEQRFESHEALAEQLKKDREQVEAMKHIDGSII